MPRFVAVYTMKPEDVAAFRARPKSEQEAIDKVGLKAWEEWAKRNAAAVGLFQDNPHITVFPGDGIDVMPVVTGPPED